MPSTLAVVLSLLTNTSPGTSSSEEHTARAQDVIRSSAEANNRFALETFRRASSTAENVLLSPVSIRLALDLLGIGTGGATRAELERILYPDCDQPWSDRAATLASELESTPPADGQLQIENALWVQRGSDIREEYLRRVGQSPTTESKHVDFRGAPGQVCDDLNAWLSKATHGKITGGWRPEAIDPHLDAVVTSALYFQGLWRHKFNIDHGKQHSFWTSPHQRVAVPVMMTLTKQLRHFRDAQWEAVVLPYRGDHWSMIVVVPQDIEAGVANLENKLDSAELSRVLISAQATQLRLEMPSFEIRSGLDITSILREDGPPLLFQRGSADLSGMTPNPNFFLGKLQHDAYIKVDPRGTEVAAATRVKIYRGPAPPPPPVMRINQPFFFAIVHEPTTTILALGKLTRPSNDRLPDQPYPSDRPWRTPGRDENAPDSVKPPGFPAGPPTGPPNPPTPPTKKGGGS